MNCCRIEEPALWRPWILNLLSFFCCPSTLLDSISFGRDWNFTRCLEVDSSLEVCVTKHTSKDAVLKDLLELLFSFQFAKNRSSFKCFEVPMLQSADCNSITFLYFSLLSFSIWSGCSQITNFWIKLCFFLKPQIRADWISLYCTASLILCRTFL